MFLEQTICICDPTHLSELSDNASFLENLQTTCSSTAVGSMCQTVHATTAIIFGFLLLATLFQVLRFWFSVSDKFKANINFLYASFIAICSIRGIRYLALYFPSFLPSQLLHALLYAPIFLAFANQTVLFLTWFELFMILSGKVKISQVKLWQRTIAATVVVLLSSILAFQYDSRYTSIPVLIGSIISIFLFVQHGLMKWKNSKVSKSGSRSRRFPLVTLLTTLSSVILLTISITVTAFSMASLFYDNHEIFFAKHSFWLFAELFFIFIQLATLNLFSVISILPLPTNSEILTNDWLTTLLREKSIISYDNSVKEYSGQKLSGGCHGKVRQIQLTYSDCSSGENYTAPKAIVVKTLSWDYNLLGKVSLSLRGQLGSYFENKATCYLKSYQIESHFYRDIAPSVKGIKLPMIYYNFEDKFNNQFGLVMEDVTYSDNPTHLPISGQPFGFTFEESRTILTQLAKFHAAFWDSKELRNYNIWDIGGYWTGDKRTSDKLKVVSQWKKSLENFAGQLLLPDEKCKKLAKRLYNNRHHLMSLYTNVNHETLIHGDFKIGNLFIDTNRTPVDFLRSNFPLPKTCTDSSDDEPSVNAIDWQWVGRGSCAIDVAYYLMTSTFPDVLNRRSLKKLVKVYHSILLAKGVQNFPFKEMWRQFQLSALDFFVYVISCKWSVLNLEKINENQQKCHDGMHIRSLSQMQQIIILAQEFVDELEFV